MTKREHETVKPQPSRIGKKSVSVYLPEDTWRDLKVLAATTDTTIDALMRRGVDLVLAERKLPKR
jgi:ribosomal protein L1